MSTWVYLKDIDDKEIYFERNITNNVAKMADVCVCWDEIFRGKGISTSKEAIPFILQAMQIIANNPDKVREKEPGNGWGTIEHFYNFLQELLWGCLEYPDCIYEVSF